MPSQSPRSNLVHQYEKALEGNAASRSPYVLRLYVTGSSPRSLRAVSNLRAICDEHLSHGCDMQVVDLFREPALASEKQILAAPTLVRERPLPARRIIGDLSDRNRVLFALDLLAIPN